jgi:hypothetical protein
MNERISRSSPVASARLPTTPPPFTKKRLALAASYDARIGRPSRAARQLPFVAIDNEAPADHHDDGETAR